MEKSSENLVHQLISLNMARIERLQGAIQYVESQRLKCILSDLSLQSQSFIMELKCVIKLYGGKADNIVSPLIQMPAFENNGLKTDSSICLVLLEYERENLSNYKFALLSGHNLDNNLFEKIRTQKTELQEGARKLWESLRI